MDYPTVFASAMSTPEAFWRERASEIEWFEFPPTILDQDDNGAYRWFRGGKLNTAWLALDRHVENGRGDATALIYDSPVTGKRRVIPSANSANGWRRSPGRSARSV